MASPASRAPAGTQWPTWLVILGVYGSWWTVICHFQTLGPWVGTPLLVLSTCWFMSLQHELLHGHPTRSRAVNRLLGIAPLAVWYPYDLYRRSHLAHHRDDLLTEPGADPESNYIGEADYRQLPAWCRPLWVAQRTVVGRLLLGPAFAVLPTWLDIVRKPLRGDLSECREWLQHLALLGALLWTVNHLAGIGPWHYALTIAYPALGLAMLRSFNEHRPADAVGHRVVVNEAGWFWRMLFLNNNYHAVHHESPGLPWHLIRPRYLAQRAEILSRNGSFVVPGYLSLIRRHAFVPIDSPVHPSR